MNAIKAFDGPGIISNEFKKEAITNVSVSMSHKITEQTRKNIYAKVQSYAGQDYKLLVQNCKNLVLDVAQTAGLRVPENRVLTLPTDVVAGLKEIYWQGRWQSDEPTGRFRLNISAQDLVWTERNSTGAVLDRKVPFTPADSNVRIERSNDDAVLTHLGYQSKLRAQIIAAGPKPSFLMLTRVDDRIESQWNGLVVTKDTNANLKQIEQPGTTPPKSYKFNRSS